MTRALSTVTGAIRTIGIAALACAAAAAPCRAQGPANRLQLRFDTSEAVAVLGILAKERAHQAVDSADWARLLVTEPYRRLKAREAYMHRAFTDSAFEAFVRSDSLQARTADLRRTLSDWERADVTGAAAKAFAYLPPEARIHAAVFPVIKPQTNSFVFDLQTDAAIFLYLDPSDTKEQFENTVAHELHHVGYASVSPRFDSSVAGLSPDARAAAEWVGAFGEGFAMLAAAGGPGVNPHWESAPADRARWDHDVANFAPDLQRVQQFLLDVAQGRLRTQEERMRAGSAFFGIQGPWYTVGWKMAVVIEQRFGRDRLIACMFDPHALLATYNQAAAELNRTGAGLPLWSTDLVGALAVPTAR